MVDAERLLVAWLKAQPEVAALVAGRVATELPPSPTWPFLRLERLGGLPLPLGQAIHVDRARVQLEAWGTTKAQAHTLAATVQAVLHERLPGRHELGTVTAVRPDLGLVWSPDPENGRARYVLAVLVFTHPNP